MMFNIAGALVLLYWEARETYLTALDRLPVDPSADVPDGYTAGQAVLATAPVAPGRFQPSEVPAIQGVAEVGQTLTLTNASWVPQPAKVKTQWYADGVAIPEATGASLVLTRDHIDRRISARVKASASGYRKSTSTAPETAPAT